MGAPWTGICVLLSFALIFPVELPDKTFVAALVLSTRYRPLAVWIGVGLAFGIQCLVAVAAGHAVSFLPDWVVHLVSTVMFLIGAIILFRAAPKADAEEKEQEEEFAAKATRTRSAGTRSSRRSSCCSPPSGATSPRS